MINTLLSTAPTNTRNAIIWLEVSLYLGFVHSSSSTSGWSSHILRCCTGYNSQEQVFVPDTSMPIDGVKLDFGTYYAAKTFFDTAHNRRILFGWSTEDR